MSDESDSRILTLPTVAASEELANRLTVICSHVQLQKSNLVCMEALNVKTQTVKRYFGSFIFVFLPSRPPYFCVTERTKMCRHLFSFVDLVKLYWNNVKLLFVHTLQEI